MQKLLDETEKSAYRFLKEFGFEEEEIAPVIAKGLLDIAHVLNSVDLLLKEQSPSRNEEKLDDLLHSLKGLLFQLGNHDMAEKIEKLRYCKDTKEQYETLKRILFQ